MIKVHHRWMLRSRENIVRTMTGFKPFGLFHSLRIVVCMVLFSGALAACHKVQQQSDPLLVTRSFIIATWTGDTTRVKKLSCPNIGWSLKGDPTLTVDAEHLKFEIVSQTEKQIEVAMSGVVTFKSTSGQTEVRNLDQVGKTVFTLENQGGWKVCDVH